MSRSKKPQTGEPAKPASPTGLDLPTSEKKKPLTLRQRSDLHKAAWAKRRAQQAGDKDQPTKTS
jgi:hypothetical protein